MTNSIVTVNVSQTIAPAPSSLQSTGAMISTGGTTGAASTRTLLTSAADLTPILKGALSLASITWSGGTATATAAVPHGIDIGDVVKLTIAGALPSGYNGTYDCTATGASAFTYAVSNPGSSPATGTPVWTPEDVAELLAMVTTFFAQGSQQSTYVLELGDQAVTDAVGLLATYIAANPGVFYAYLVPRTWDANAAFLALVATYEALTAKTYFYVTTTTGNYAQYTALMKSVFALVEAPGIPATEFTCAWPFWVALQQQPSSTSKVPPMAFTFGFGVTPYPVPGNSALLASLKAAKVNVAGTGAEGGISDVVLFWGTTMDGQDLLKWWYGIDWAQINAELVLANAVINGSNSSFNPLYYNQQGIHRLQGVVANLMSNGVTYGIVLGQVIQVELSQAEFLNNLELGVYGNTTVVNAEPFTVYTAEHPSDYAAGRYAGLSVAMVPQLGFKAIVFNLNVSNFVGG